MGFEDCMVVDEDKVGVYCCWLQFAKGVWKNFDNLYLFIGNRPQIITLGDKR